MTRDDRLRRAAHARLHRRARRRHARAPTDVLEAREGDLELPLTRDGRGDELTLDFTGRAAQHDGQPQLPAGGHALGLLVRRARAHRPRHPAERRRLPADHVVAPEGSLLNARPPAAVVAGNVETSSRVADLVLAAFGRALGQGTMNNVMLGTDDVHVLRDARRRPGRVRGRRRPERRARRDVQHAQHAGRGARAGVPAARPRVRDAARQRRRGRHRGGDGVVRELEALDDMALSLLTERRRHAPPGAAGGEPGAPRAQPARRRGARAEGAREPARRPAPADRDARRRRTWQVSLIGFIGLGIMGSRMAANLARAGHDLRVYNRTREKAEAWAAEHGGTRGRHAARGGRGRDGGDHDGRRRPAGRGGAARRATARPHGAAPRDALRRHVDDRAARTRAGSARRSPSASLRFVDAPVTGSSPKAEDGTLTIMAGGGDADFARAEPYFEAMGEVILHVGPLGHGQKIKVIYNAVAAANCATLAQALVVGKATGVDLEALVQVIGAGSAGSTMVGAQGRSRCAQHDYTTLFQLEHMLKDVRLCLEESAGRRRAVPGRRRSRASSTPPRWAAGSASRTSRRCSRWSRGSPASGSDAASAAGACMPAYHT